MKQLISLQGAHSKQGLPTYWEKRTSNPMLRTVELICNGDFSPKKPTFLNREPGIKKTFHAMFLVKTGDIIVQASQDNDGNIAFYLMLVRFVETRDDGKFTIKASAEHSHVSDEFLSDEYGKTIIPVLEAAVAKLDSDAVETFYSQPHNLHERIAEKQNTKED